MKAVGGRTNERTAYDVPLASGHQGDPFLALALVTYQGYAFSISSHSCNSYSNYSFQYSYEQISIRDILRYYFILGHRKIFWKFSKPRRIEEKRKKKKKWKRKLFIPFIIIRREFSIRSKIFQKLFFISNLSKTAAELQNRYLKKKKEENTRASFMLKYFIQTVLLLKIHWIHYIWLLFLFLSMNLRSTMIFEW